MTISAVARQSGFRASAIRYYESIGLLTPPHRRAGQRSYDVHVLRRLAVIRQARDAGFTLDEIRSLVQSRGDLWHQWNSIAERKLEEIEREIERLRSRQALIQHVQQACTCLDADQCGARMLSSNLSPTIAPENPHIGR